MSLRKQSRRTLLTSIMLVAFALRALIPTGFMLGGDQRFPIEICWDGLPAAMLASMDMGSMDMRSMDMGSMPGGHQHSAGEHCLFGTACGSGPLPHLALPVALVSGRQLAATEISASPNAVRLVHLPQSRAPPVQLS